ncbi:hypothetical protein PIB30_051615 [Stylosanthes scabra]|uniref:Uncharacterized protein n=1 Tax=Stylosanthes scabra TaxID=79078 RepID=A0ABU6SHV6_9FABA|nr:hypothetical protein [Stylosanthes scabra]
MEVCLGSQMPSLSYGHHLESHSWWSSDAMEVECAHPSVQVNMICMEGNADKLQRWWKEMNEMMKRDRR